MHNCGVGRADGFKEQNHRFCHSERSRGIYALTDSTSNIVHCCRGDYQSPVGYRQSTQPQRAINDRPYALYQQCADKQKFSDTENNCALCIVHFAFN